VQLALHFSLSLRMSSTWSLFNTLCIASQRMIFNTLLHPKVASLPFKPRHFDHSYGLWYFSNLRNQKVWEHRGTSNIEPDVFHYVWILLSNKFFVYSFTTQSCTPSYYICRNILGCDQYITSIRIWKWKAYWLSSVAEFLRWSIL
jgi:hypothetical protein